MWEQRKYQELIDLNWIWFQLMNINKNTCSHECLKENNFKKSNVIYNNKKPKNEFYIYKIRVFTFLRICSLQTLPTINYFKPTRHKVGNIYRHSSSYSVARWGIFPSVTMFKVHITILCYLNVSLLCNTRETL